ncbi:MAG: hypothetical protein CSB16_00280 [Clostridiales bacterium]|nr:MAG: hypothetical protein CSB16_00280 [Clostridiales bacterium]
MNLSRYNNKKSHFVFLYGYAFSFMITALLFNTPAEIFDGLIKIMFSTGNLITDYMYISNVGAALFNSGLVTLFSTILVNKNTKILSGPLIAAIFVISGFSLFGKNLFNTLPFIIGALVYAKIEKMPYNRLLVASLFGSALGPLISEIAFGIDLPIGVGIITSYLVGIFIGIILPILSSRFLIFHQGYSLYNAGFTAGIVGMFAVATLRMFGVEIATTSLVYNGNTNIFYLMLIVFFSILFVVGFSLNNNSVNNFSSLLKNKGRLVSDFTSLYGFGLTLINMSILGFMATFYVYIVGGQLNGPVMGGILTVVGFGAFGKTPKNSFPIFIGVYIALILNIYDVKSTAAVLAALFGTTLAPIAGEYGILGGIIAGFIHMGLVTNIGFLHGGVNLYNNGFSGGFVAAFLAPIFDVFRDIKYRSKNG